MSPIGAEKARARGILLALLSASSFSTLGLFAKLIYSEGFSIQQALAWRFTVASTVLWAFIALSSRTRARRPAVGRKLWPVLALGFAGFAPQAGMYFVTVSILDPGIAGLLLYLYPSFVILLSLAIFRKKPNRIQTLSLVLSLAGCALTFFKPGSYPLVGLGLGAVMAMFYGSYLIISERVLEGVDTIRATALIMFAAALAYWAITIATGTVRLPGSIVSVAGILGVGVVATVLPITTLFAAMKRIGAADTSLVSTFEPVLTIVLSALIIGERLGPAQAIGGAFILAAVIVLRFEPSPGKVGSGA